MAKLKSKKPLVIAIVIAAIVVLLGLWVLIRNGVFADIVDPPRFTSFTAGKTVGQNEITYLALTNFTANEMYMWWDCADADPADSKATLISKCGVPYEVTDFSTNVAIGDITKGARVRTYARGGAYHLRVPQKYNAKAVVFASSSTLPNGIAKTVDYSTDPNRTSASYPGIPNFNMSTYDDPTYGKRFLVEKLDQADGQVPNRKYVFWYDCANTDAITTSSTVAEVTAICGTPNVNTSRPSDRYHIYRTNLTPGVKNFVSVVEEFTCSIPSYHSNGCVWSGNSIFTGKKTYTVSSTASTTANPPTFTSFSAMKAKGANKITFSALTNFSANEMYIWWDCRDVTAADDTKAELFAKCGTPHELTNIPSNTSVGDITKGARIRTYSRGGAYKITLPQKTDARAVVYAASSNVPNGLIRTIQYSTDPDRKRGSYALDPNFYMFAIDGPPYGWRYEVEKTNDPDGQMPNRRYSFWYDCDPGDLPTTSTLADVTEKCGKAPDLKTERPSDRYHYYKSKYTTGSKTFVAVVEQSVCNSASYLASTQCSWPGTSIFAGKINYTIPVAASPTPTPSVAPSVTNSVDPSQVSYVFHSGFNAMGSTTQTNAQTISSQGLSVLSFSGPLNTWLQYPNSTNTPLSIQPFKGYYVYNSTQTDKTVVLPNNASAQPSYALETGWNMFWTLNETSFSSLRLIHNGVSKTPNELISGGVIIPEIFVVNNDRATTSCQYFTLLTGAATSTPSDCANDIKAKTTSIPAGKAFWIYVN